MSSAATCVETPNGGAIGCVQLPPSLNLKTLFDNAAEAAINALLAGEKDDGGVVADVQDDNEESDSGGADANHAVNPRPQRIDAPDVSVDTSSSASQPSPRHAKGIEKRRSKDRSKALRNIKRNKADAASGTTRKVKRVAEKYRQRGIPIQTSVNVRGTSPVTARDGAAGPGGLPVTPKAFTARRYDATKSDEAPLTKDEALAMGLRYVEWNGRDVLPVLFSDVLPVLDSDGVVFAVCAGTPKGDSWAGALEEAQKALDEARAKLNKKGKDLKHRRGCFAVFASGISFGGGQKEPCNTSYSGSKVKEQVRIDLLSNSGIQRIAEFGDMTFRVYAPRLYDYYSTTLEAVLDHDRTLLRNFDNSAFASMTFNLGPRTETYVHADHQNLPAGWCAVTALGDYEPTLGGHIILWDAKLVIEFPPGATILIPSALIRHSNTTVGPNEKRYSLTQYSAGGLFRWVECGFQSEKDFGASGCEYVRTGRERWLSGVDMFSTWSELCSSP